MYRKALKPAVPAEQENRTENPMCPLMTLTVDETAKELHISRPNAYDLVKRPDFPSFRIGCRILINRAGLQRWIDKQSEQPLDDLPENAA